MSRPTLQAIADRLGISKMTVSRALRGEPHVTASLREQVKQAAQELGYRPDPEISKLMAHMRRSRRSASPRTLGFIWAERTAAEVRHSPWSMHLIAGVRGRADHLGFHVSEFHLADKGMTAARLSGILEARGIPGFILSPLLSRSRGHLSTHWEKFSSVVIGLGYARPARHRVHHHHYLGMMTAMRQLRKLGYRRIGFFSGTTVNERMFGAWSASFLTHHPLPVAQAAELLCLKRTPSKTELLEWVKRARPQVVIDGGVTAYDWLKGFSIPMDIGYATLAWQPERPVFSGIDQQPDVLGAAAVDLLVEQFHHNEHGAPEHPKFVMTEGLWREGTTVRRVR
ncbi:MAG: LacI family DNA-binding transcriptional regulator [Chryseolinea sp.]